MKIGKLSQILISVRSWTRGQNVRRGMEMSDRDMVRNEVLYHGMTLQIVMDKYPL